MHTCIDHFDSTCYYKNILVFYFYLSATMASIYTSFKALARLVALFVTISGAGVAASPSGEEQQPIADPAADAFDDTIWTSSPLYERAISLMKESPLIDTHIDLPQVIRSLGKPSQKTTTFHATYFFFFLI